MAFVTLEDMVGQTEIIVFPRDYERYRSNLFTDNKIFVKGRASVTEEEAKLVMSDMLTFEEVEAGNRFSNYGSNYRPQKRKEPEIEESKTQVWVCFETMEDYTKSYDDLTSILDEYKGNSPVYVMIRENRQMKKMGRGFMVNAASEVVDVLKLEYGSDKVITRESK
jgi:DNA polymerase-3 subunit alpha